LDEKMKDAVKITVIATAFKDSDMRSRQESRLGFAMPEINYPPQRDYSHRESMPDPEPAMVMEESVERPGAEAVASQTMQKRSSLIRTISKCPRSCASATRCRQ